MSHPTAPTVACRFGRPGVRWRDPGGNLTVLLQKRSSRVASGGPFRVSATVTAPAYDGNMQQTLTPRYELSVLYPNGMVARATDVQDQLRHAGIRFQWYVRTSWNRNTGTTVRVICHDDPSTVVFPGSSGSCSARFVPGPVVVDDPERYDW